MYPPLGQVREWVSVNSCPRGHVCGVFGGSYPYLRYKPYLNSNLWGENFYFLKGSTLRQINAPYLDARFNVSFFSDKQFSIVLAFFCAMCCLRFNVSVYQCLFCFSYL